MSTRLTTVPSTGRSVADPVPRSILAVDVEGSTQRTNPVKGELRRIMYALLYRALRATGVDHEHLEKPADRGDGVMLLFRPHDNVPKTLLLGQLIPKLAALLVEHNAAVSEPDLRLRLRAVFHAGEVHDDGWGFYGEDIDVACRLLDAPSVKKALKDATASPLVLVVSEEIHSAIVRHGYVDVGPQVRSVSVRVARRLRRGRVTSRCRPRPNVRSRSAGRGCRCARRRWPSLRLPRSPKRRRADFRSARKALRPSTPGKATNVTWKRCMVVQLGEWSRGEILLAT